MADKHRRRLTVLVSPQTSWNLTKLAKMEGCSVGRVIDKLVRDKMLSLRSHPPDRRPQEE